MNFGQCFFKNNELALYLQYIIYIYCIYLLHKSHEVSLTTLDIVSYLIFLFCFLNLTSSALSFSWSWSMNWSCKMTIKKPQSRRRLRPIQKQRLILSTLNSHFVVIGCSVETKSLMTNKFRS